MPSGASRTSAPAVAPIGPVAGRRVTVMGLGRFGGGTGVVRWLAERGARVVVSDRAEEHDLASSIAEVSDLVAAGTLELHLGGHDDADFRGADLVVVNPAVPHPWRNPHLVAARAAGVPLTTELRIVTERIDRARTIGVTGTAGKSTVASMVAFLLERLGHPAHLGGNIGGSLLERIDRIEPGDWVVLECSSAQLHWLGPDAEPGWDAPPWSPHVAVLTNLRPHHLDWHESAAHYERSKRVLLEHQAEGDHAITEDLVHLRRPLPLSIPGEHNQRNGMLAMLAVLRAVGAMPPQTAPLLADYPGLPHRLRRVAGAAGLVAIDDSKATTPEGTVLAVGSFKRPSRLHLIAGGHARAQDPGPIAALAPRLGGIYTIGATGEALAEAAEAAIVAARADGRPVATGRVVRCGTLEAAVEAAWPHLRADAGAVVAAGTAEDEPPAVLLLSPGAASWDQFTDYRQRAEAFTATVRRMLEGTGA